jgi:hypothetical protein
VSIHALACAGLDVLNDLGEPLGELAMRYDPNRFRPGMYKEWLQAVTKSRNFFKHAERDPNGTLDFNPKTNKHLLAECSDLCLRVTGEQTPVMGVFWRYFMLHDNRFFNPVIIEQLPIDLKSLPKEQFFEECLPVLSGVPLR